VCTPDPIAYQEALQRDTIELVVVVLQEPPSHHRKLSRLMKMRTGVAPVATAATPAANLAGASH
jgi:hypothetical protein